MRKFSLKTARVVLSIAFGLVLFACPKPVSVEDFLNDPAVIDIVEKGKESAKIKMPGSDSGLTGGNTQISGLKPGNYYMVEEYDENEVFLKTWVVKGGVNGSLSDDPDDIGRVSGGRLTGLTNFYYYRVWSAAALESVTYGDAASSPPPTTQTVTLLPTAGKITLLEPEDDYFLDVSAYDTIYEFPILPTPNTAGQSQTIQNGYIPLIKTKGEESDYLFVKGFDHDTVFPNSGKFDVLRVKIEGMEDLEVTITALNTTDKTVTLSATSTTISQATLETNPAVVITFTDTPNAWTVVEWRLGGATITGAVTKVLTLSFTSSGNAGIPPAVGDHIVITLIVRDSGGVSYSGYLTLEIN